MSVRVTTLPSGLRIVTQDMPHLESAAIGIWVGAGSRSERDEEHGLSHLLEHMAFKGTTTRSAADIAEEIEAVGGEVNAATSVETTSYYARILKADVPARPRHPLRHPPQLGVRPRGARARAACHPPGDRRGARCARGPRLRHLRRVGLPRPADRPQHPRHGRDGEGRGFADARLISRPALSRPGDGRRRGGRRRPRPARRSRQPLAFRPRRRGGPRAGGRRPIAAARSARSAT